MYVDLHVNLNYLQTKHPQEEKEAGNTNHSTKYKRYERTCNIRSAKFISMLCHPIDPHIISDSPCSPTVYWIAKLNLTPDDRAIVQEGGQLNDKIIAGVGMILESQFPELPQFQLTLYTQAIENFHPAEEGSLFFHLLWLLLSPSSLGMTLALSCTTRKRCGGI